MIATEKMSEIEQKAIEARRKYQKEWRAKNKERVRCYNKRFWEKKAAEMAAKNVE